MRIKIKDEFSDDYTTRPAGERLRELILSSDSKVTIDFEGVKMASTSFFDEAFGKLAKDHAWKAMDFKEKIELLNLYKHDQTLLRQVCQMRGLAID